MDWRNSFPPIDNRINSPIAFYTIDLGVLLRLPHLLFGVIIIGIFSQKKSCCCWKRRSWNSPFSDRLHTKTHQLTCFADVVDALLGEGRGGAERSGSATDRAGRPRVVITRSWIRQWRRRRALSSPKKGPMKKENTLLSVAVFVFFLPTGSLNISMDESLTFHTDI